MAPKPTATASANCCTSRDPPSPDGLPPRPAISPLKSPGKAPRHPTPSWSTALSAQIGAELRAIFEDDKSETGGESSPNTKPKAKLTPKLKSLLGSDKLETQEVDKLRVKKTRSAKLRSVLEGDDNDPGHVHCHIPPPPPALSNETLNPLSAVKNRLRKALSKDSGFSKRQLRASVGTSEEEIERRAELRRIRQKRIRDELSLDEMYDEDATSVAGSVVRLNSLLPRKSGKPWSPGDFLPLPELRPVCLMLPSYEFPMLPMPVERQDRLLQPRAGSLTSPPLSPQPRSDTQTSFFNNTAPEASRISTISRRHSSPLLTDYVITPASELLAYKPTRKRSSFPPTITPPIPKPKSNNSVGVPAKSSWRSTFTTTNRSAQLRNLSQGTLIPTLAPDQLSSRAPISRWLHSQGLRMSSQVITDTSESADLSTSQSKTSMPIEPHDFGGVDGEGGPSEDTPRLHEMRISQRLASHRLHSSSSSPQLSSWGSREQGASSGGGVNHRWSRRGEGERRGFLYDTSEDSVPLSERIPRSWGEVVRDGGSSVYTARVGSKVATRESSRLDLSMMMGGMAARMDRTEMGVIKNPSTLIKALTDPSFLPTAAYSTTSLAPPSHNQESPSVRRHTLDNTSLAHSTTSSLLKTEAELLVIQHRFPSSNPSHQRPSTPRSSKFREEFTSPPPSTHPPSPHPSHTSSEGKERERKPNPLTRSKTVISRLVKRVTRTFDGPDDTNMEDLLSVPILDLSPGALKHAGGHLLSPLADESVQSLWGEAVRAHQGRSEARKNKGAAGTAGVSSGRTLGVPSSKGAWGKAVQKKAGARTRDVADNLHIPGGTTKFGKEVQRNNIPKARRIARNLYIPLGRKGRRREDDDGDGHEQGDMDNGSSPTTLSQHGYSQLSFSAQSIAGGGPGSFSMALRRTLSLASRNSKTPGTGSRLTGSTATTPGFFRIDEAADEERALAAAEYDRMFRERLAQKEKVMASWEKELEEGARRARSRSREVVRRERMRVRSRRGRWRGKGKGTGGEGEGEEEEEEVDRRFPKSWARWASHDRAERSASAGREEGVVGRDWAIVGVTEEGEVRWCRKHGRKRHLYHWAEHHQLDLQGVEGKGKGKERVEVDDYEHSPEHDHDHDHSHSIDHPNSHTDYNETPHRGRSLLRTFSPTHTHTRHATQSPSSCTSLHSVHSRLQAFEEAFQRALYKFETSGEQGLADQVHGRRSSLNLEGALEFPELEILGRLDVGRGREMGVGDGGGDGWVGTAGDGMDDEGKDEGANNGGEHVGWGGARLKRDLRASASLSESVSVSIADPRFYDDCIDNRLLFGAGDGEDDGVVYNAVEEAEVARAEGVTRDKVGYGRERAERGGMERESIETLDIYEDAREGMKGMDQEAGR